MAKNTQAGRSPAGQSGIASFAPDSFPAFRLNKTVNSDETVDFTLCAMNQEGSTAFTGRLKEELTLDFVLTPLGNVEIGIDVSIAFKEASGAAYEIAVDDSGVAAASLTLAAGFDLAKPVGISITAQDALNGDEGVSVALRGAGVHECNSKALRAASGDFSVKPPRADNSARTGRGHFGLDAFSCLPADGNGVPGGLKNTA